MRKPPPILPAKGEFIFGNCVSIALSQAFSIPFPALKIIFKSLKMNIDDGCSFWECTKIITLLCKNFNFKVKYVSNTTGVTYKQLVNILTEGKQLVMFDIHLSYVKDGKILDSYYYDSNIERNEIRYKKDAMEIMERQLRRIPTGWWIINQ